MFTEFDMMLEETLLGRLFIEQIHFPKGIKDPKIAEILQRYFSFFVDREEYCRSHELPYEEPILIRLVINGQEYDLEHVSAMKLALRWLPKAKSFSSEIACHLENDIETGEDALITGNAPFSSGAAFDVLFSDSIPGMSPVLEGKKKECFQCTGITVFPSGYRQVRTMIDGKYESVDDDFDPALEMELFGDEEATDWLEELDNSDLPEPPEGFDMNDVGIEFALNRLRFREKVSFPHGIENVLFVDAVVQYLRHFIKRVRYFDEHPEIERDLIELEVKLGSEKYTLDTPHVLDDALKAYDGSFPIDFQTRYEFHSAIVTGGHIVMADDEPGISGALYEAPGPFTYRVEWHSDDMGSDFYLYEIIDGRFRDIYRRMTVSGAKGLKGPWSGDGPCEMSVVSPDPLPPGLLGRLKKAAENAAALHPGILHVYGPISHEDDAFGELATLKVEDLSVLQDLADHLNEVIREFPPHTFSVLIPMIWRNKDNPPAFVSIRWLNGRLVLKGMRF